MSAKYEFHRDEANNVGVGGFVLPQAGATSFHHDYRIELSDQYVFSSNALNNFRMALGTNYQQVNAQTNASSIIVPGSFQEGGAQIDNWRKEPRYEFQNTFSLVKGSFTLKVGGNANLHPFQSYSVDNFGGTYQFASLAAYETAQPLLFTLNQGNPLIVSDQDDYAWFVQIEKQFSRVTLFAGVRHEFQSHFDRYGNLAPRIAAAWSLDRSSQTVLRVGTPTRMIVHPESRATPAAKPVSFLSTFISPGPFPLNDGAVRSIASSPSIPSASSITLTRAAMSAFKPHHCLDNRTPPTTGVKCSFPCRPTFERIEMYVQDTRTCASETQDDEFMIDSIQESSGPSRALLLSGGSLS
ncbi:MAG: hypothetical protein M3Y57_19355 [Acidobacteriota bacterium]|nr:hypothetical protein [Acidobacteriota bacterium]